MLYRPCSGRDVCVHQCAIDTVSVTYLGLTRETLDLLVTFMEKKETENKIYLKSKSKKEVVIIERPQLQKP